MRLENKIHIFAPLCNILYKLFAVFPACCYFWGYSHFGSVSRMLSTDHNKKIDTSFFAGVVRKMLIISGDPDCIVLHCLLYFLHHIMSISFNCSGTVMSRPFPHSCKQRHQVEAWMDKIQWFVWNCPPESQPHFFMFDYWCGLWERSVRQESYDFCVFPSLPSFSHFAPELVGKIFGFFRCQ